MVFRPDSRRVTYAANNGKNWFVGEPSVDVREIARR
jgi:hypothetical protein